jgi:hypothetical protein
MSNLSTAATVFVSFRHFRKAAFVSSNCYMQELWSKLLALLYGRTRFTEAVHYITGRQAGRQAGRAHEVRQQRLRRQFYKEFEI